MGHDMLVRARMHTQRGIHILKETLTDKAALGAAILAAFLPGGTVDPDFAADLVDNLLQGRAGKD